MKAGDIVRQITVDVLVLAVVGFASVALAQETVTIPKARLAELERKEAELEKLKKELHRAQGEKEQLQSEQERLKAEKAQLKKAKEEAEARAGAAAAAAQSEPRISYVSPPLASLPPLQPDEVVNAMDLMNHYVADAAAAEQRYGKGTLQVQGEVVGLEKLMFVRHYTLLLKTADAQKRVVCTVHPPDQYKTLYTVKNGTELAWANERQGPVTFVKVGQTVIVEGKCKGLRDAGVAMSGCALKSAQ
jgi:Skp family chaperone for outer membrane proteins